MKANSKFAVFDIDGTVIRWQLYHAIVGELARRNLLAAGAAEKIEQARMTWKKRTHDGSFQHYEHELVQAYHEALTRIRVADFRDAVDTVFEEHKDQVYTYTRDLIRRLKDEGYKLFTISGSHQEIIEKLAAYYGFDDFVGNIYEQKDRFFTGTSTGIVGKKGQLLQEMAAKHNVTFKGSIAVGDSEGDIAMFELVEQPIAFNPTAGLLARAKEDNWKIVVERKNVIYELESQNGQYVLLG